MSRFPDEPNVVRLRPSEEKPDGPNAIDWLALSEREPPPREWAIKGWLGYGHVTLLIGQGGIGKTLIAQQIGSCLAIGRSPFIDEVPAQAKVLMWACEDDHDELWRRQVPIARWLKTGIESFGDFVLVPRHGCDNAMVTSEFGKLQFTGNLLTLKEQALDLQARVVILDNVAQIYGANENDRYSVTAFMNALSGALPGVAILMLGHPSRGLNSEFSGSSAWENVARTRLYLGANLPDQKSSDDEPQSADTRFVSRRKSNYSSKDYRRCTYRDGVLIPDEQEQPSGIFATLKAAKGERVVIDGLRRLAEMGLAPTDGTTSPRYLPRLMAEYKLTEGLTRGEVAGAMRHLMLDGRLIRGEVGKTEKRNPIYGLKAKEST